MEACRLRALFRNVPPFSLQKFVSFCSVSAANPSQPNFFSNDSESGSSVYRHALKFQRPTIINWRYQLYNSVSFIGSVEFPLKVTNTNDGSFGVYTLLRVRTSSNSQQTFRILLQMWERLAEISFRHLKPNDFIYVSGRLGCYTKADMNGRLRTYYKVYVDDLNYVAQHGQGVTSQKIEKSDSKGDAGLESRLHLWQLFFANPYEWWDNRKSKSNSKRPDFRHKDTNEAIWISQNDPPWVRRQLQLHDSRMAEQGHIIHASPHSRLSEWVYDDQE